jgi:thioesterase domain-containing protein/NAD(P)-dependent dehydrogenase (short-subunit alcohol dehydrogenase family)/acyl carrier protein
LIDVVRVEPESAAEAALVGVLLAEVTLEPPAPRVALRDGDRWLPAVEPLRLGDDAAEVRTFRSQGTYLITGGLGRVGLALGRHLARVAQARLVLVTHTPFPLPPHWSRWCNEHPPDDVTSARILALRALEALGAEVLVLEADVADASAMSAALACAEVRFGPLHGVVHAAGSRSEGHFVTPLRQADRAACEAHFRPKVHGTYVLHDLLHARVLDFCVLVSSTSALLGGPGLGPYAAANRFMDAFVQAHRHAHRGSWMVLDWDAWNFDDAARDLAMSPDEGCEAFDRAVRRGGARHLIVATASLESRLARWVQPKGPQAARSAASAETRRHARPALGAPLVAPRSELEQRVAGVFARVLGFEAVGVDDDLFELGGDSLTALQIVTRLQTELGQNVSPALLLQSPTVAALSARLEQPQSASRSPAVPIQPRGDAPPLFWVPGTGGNVLYFHPLARALEPAGHPFYGLEAIGTDGREPPHSSVPDIARSYILALRAIQPHGPYYIGGHSFGSWVAYELAQQLLDLGESVHCLAVLDTVAPALRDLAYYREFTGADWIVTMAGIVGNFLGRPLMLSRQTLLGLSWDEQLDELCEALQAVGFMPPGAERRRIQGLVDVYRTQAQMEYRRPPGQPVRIALFRASALDAAGGDVPEAIRSDPSWGWQAYAAGPVSLEDVPGDHLTMMTHPHVQTLAERVRVHL